METVCLCSVRDKISCVFETTVVHETASRKRPEQPFQVVAAADRVRPEAAFLFSSESSAHATEKLDGTCTAVRRWDGRPWLWARHDRKPNKAAEKRFRAVTSGRRGSPAAGGDEDTTAAPFVWNVEADLRDVPLGWTPAGSGVPDVGGHIPGWVPVDPKSRTHCWHLSAIDLEEDPGVALVLQPQAGLSGLEVTVRQLSDLDNCTMELIGTNVNANPYHIGSKQRPIHFLMRHGILPILDNLRAPESLAEWFDTSAGAVEGIVWHCADGSLFKLHRHHLSLKWPIERPRLMTLPVVVNLEAGVGSDFVQGREFAGSKLIQSMCKLNGCSFPSIADLKLDNV